MSSNIVPWFKKHYELFNDDSNFIKIKKFLVNLLIVHIIVIYQEPINENTTNHILLIIFS
jgi:hypothetical protein